MTYDLFTFQSQSNSKTKADKGNPTSSLVARSSNLDILNDSVTQSQCQCWGLCINSLGRVVAVAGSPSPESRLLCLGLGPGPSNWQESMNQMLDCKFQWCWLHYAYYACLSLSLSPARLQSMGPSCVVVTVNLGTDYDDNEYCSIDMNKAGWTVQLSSSTFFNWQFWTLYHYGLAWLMLMIYIIH